MNVYTLFVLHSAMPGAYSKLQTNTHIVLASDVAHAVRLLDAPEDFQVYVLNEQARAGVVTTEYRTLTQTQVAQVITNAHGYRVR